MNLRSIATECRHKVETAGSLILFDLDAKAYAISRDSVESMEDQRMVGMAKYRLRIKTAISEQIYRCVIQFETFHLNFSILFGEIIPV